MKLSSEDKDSVPTKYDKIRKQVKLLGRIDVEIHEASRDRKDLYTKWQDFLKSTVFKKSQPYEKTLLGLDFAVHEVGNNNAIDELIDSTIQTTPLFINRFSYSDYNLIVTALKWFKTPQQALKGDVPWRIMQTEHGRRRVRRAIIETSLRDIAGSLPYEGKTKTIEEMDEAITTGANLVKLSEIKDRR